MARVSGLGGTLLAISDGENPTDPPASWSIYAIYDPTAVCTSNSDFTTCGGDQPRLGFNTNWITIWTDRETSSKTAAQLFTTSKHDAECAGITASQITPGLNNLIAPAITYKTNGQDLDGATQYFVGNRNENAGQIAVYELTGTPTSGTFNSTPIYTPATTVNGGWSSIPLPNIKQKGGSFIVPGNQDDRFTGVVVRDHAIWAAQTIALPASNPSETAVQWWQIAIDTNSPSDGTVTDQERAGTHGTKYNGLDGNATDASIAVNAAGDAVVGYSVVPYDEAAGTWGYLGAGYTFQNHSDCQEAFGPTIYQKGVGLFPVASTLARTGDYTGTAVDPMDDTSFITSAVSAGSQSGSYYYWSQSAALISPIAPPEPTFITSVQTETECVSSQQNCSVTLTAPGKSKNGDMFIIAVSSGLAPGSLTTPTGWINLPFVNQSNVVKLHAADNCGVAYTTWMPTKVFGGTPGTSQIKFTVPEVNGGGCSGNESNEIGAFLLDYRNTCQNVVNQFNGQSNFTAYGYNPVGDSTRISTGQITAPDNTTLLDIFQAAGSESAEDSGLCEDYTSISATPQLTAETPRTACDGMQMLAADLYTGATTGANYGGYSTSEQYSGPNIGFHILVPPW